MIKIKSTHAMTLARSVQRQMVLPALLLASSSVLLLSGCSSALNLGQGGAAGPSDVSAMHGTVHGGQAAIAGATVSLYEIPIGGSGGTALGYGSAITGAQLLGTATSSGSGGSWSIPSPSQCANQNDELYLVAAGGEGYNTGNPANSALVLTSVAGPCNNQFTTTFNIDEVTTVATEYALSGFSTGYLNVGTSAGNSVGLVNAFATVTNLVNLSAGTANTITPYYANPANLPANSTPDVFSSIVPDDLINTLADVLSTCVNAAGGASDPACVSLFSYTGGANSLQSGNGINNSPNASITLNTADAALYIAHNPGLPGAGGVTQPTNIAAVRNLTPSQPPFGPVLGAAPNDFTITLSFTGGGIGGIRSTSDGGGVYMAIDVNGNIWIPEKTLKTLAKLSNLGVPLSPSTQVHNTSPFALISPGGFSGIGASAASSTEFVDTDSSGNVWLGDTTNCLIGVNSSGSPLSGSPFTSACGGNTGARTVQVDASNNVWLSTSTSEPSFVTAVSNSAPTTPLTGFPQTAGFSLLTGFIGPDESSRMWFLDQGTNSAGYISTAGVVTVPPTYEAVFGGGAGLFAAFGTNGVGGPLVLWVPQSAADDIQPVEAESPYAPLTSFIPSTSYASEQIEADGNDNFFWDNGGDSAVGVPPNITVFASGPVQISPYDAGYTGGSALMGLAGPTGMSIDQSGNVWVLNSSNFAAQSEIGPYGSSYLGNGTGSSTLIEFVGLAAPTQPLNSLKAKNGTYGVKP